MAPHPNIRRLTVISAHLLVAVNLLVPSITPAQETLVSVRDQLPILLKALTFDRNLRTRCADTLVLGILYQSGYHQSEVIKEEFMRVAGENAFRCVEDIPIRMVPIDLSRGTDLHTRIPAHGVTTLYVTPLRATDLKRIVAVTRKSRVLTLTGTSSYVENGLSIGVESKDKRLSLVINRRAFRAEGANLDSQLLQLARIIR
jgi:hypothetical protein